MSKLSRPLRSRVPLVITLAVPLLGGCRPKKPPEAKSPPAPAVIKYDQELPPGEKALRKVPRERRPDERYKKFRDMGRPGREFVEAVEAAPLRAPTKRARSGDAT